MARREARLSKASAREIAGALVSYLIDEIRTEREVSGEDDVYAYLAERLWDSRDVAIYSGIKLEARIEGYGRGYRGQLLTAKGGEVWRARFTLELLFRKVLYVSARLGGIEYTRVAIGKHLKRRRGH